MGNCFGLKRKSKTVDRNEDISSMISNGAPSTCPAASAMHPDMETALRRGEELAKDLNLGKILNALKRQPNTPLQTHVYKIMSYLNRAPTFRNEHGTVYKSF